MIPEDEQRLAIAGRLNGGVVPVPFLGTTWRERGGAYWRRRVGAVILLLALVTLVGAVATGFTLGLDKGGGPILATIYVFTVLPGMWVGYRQVARAPLTSRRARLVYPVGCLAFLVAPFAVGATLIVLGSMVGREFPGERRAREATAKLHR